MKCWNFKVFIEDNGVNEISDWLEGLPKKDRAKIRTTINFLEITKVLPQKLFKKYKGYTDIYELRVYFNKVQYRPLGCFGPGHHEITLLVPAIEQGDRIIPRRAPRIAEDKCKLIHQDRRYIDDFV